MGKSLYVASDDGGIQFVSKRKAWQVGIPIYVYDLWLPVLGAKIFGIYCTYCRLEREGEVKGITLNRLATVFGVSKTTLIEANQTLQDFGFIKIKSPEGVERLKHWTTSFEVLDPPQKLPAGLPAPLCPWLVGEAETEPPVVLPSTADGTRQYPDVVLPSTAMIESYYLNPLGGESDKTPTEPDYLSDVVGRIQQGQNGKSGISVPEDDPGAWLQYQDLALAKYRELTGLYPDSQVGRPAIMHLAGTPGFDLTRFESSIISCRLAGVNPGNIGCIIDTYKDGGDYRAMKQHEREKEHGLPPGKQEKPTVITENGKRVRVIK